MFEEAGKVGGLDVQLVYFRGFNECRASRWVSDTRALRDLMTGIDCRGGHTQIGKVLTHARTETGKRKVDVARLRRRRAGGADRRPCREGRRARPARRAALHLPGGPRPDGRARLPRTGAAYRAAPMRASTPTPPASLPQLLRAAAVYAAGGLRRLQKSGGGARCSSSSCGRRDGLSRRRRRRSRHPVPAWRGLSPPPTRAALVRGHPLWRRRRADRRSGVLLALAERWGLGFL